MNKNKKFDAIQMIREKLSMKYWKHADILKKKLEAICKMYNLHLTSLFLPPNESLRDDPSFQNFINPRCISGK